LGIFFNKNLIKHDKTTSKKYEYNKILF